MVDSSILTHSVTSFTLLVFSDVVDWIIGLMIEFTAKKRQRCIVRSVCNLIKLGGLTPSVNWSDALIVSWFVSTNVNQVTILLRVVNFGTLFSAFSA